MGTDVVPTEQELKIARDGIKVHIDAVYHEDTPYTLEDFLENQAQVIATLRAYNDKLENIINSREPDQFDRF